MALELTNIDIHNRALCHLQSILNRHERFLNEFPNMPIPIVFPDNEPNINRLIRKEQ